MSSRVRLIRRFALSFFGALAVAAASIASAAEIASNGAGGGEWTDPATWRGKVAPTAADDVVISKNDTVIVTRDDSDKNSCQKLYLDPGSVLTWKTGGGKLVLTVADALESFGTIRLDGTKSASDHFELQLVGLTPEKRKVKFVQGSALVVMGRPNLPDGAHNVTFASRPKIDVKKESPQAIVELVEGTTLELQRADLVDTIFVVTGIDNTGAKPNERLNVVDNRFTGTASIDMTSCDTPVIAGNTFEHVGAQVPHAIYLNGCALPEIRGNHVLGGFSYGIMGYGELDGAVTQNEVEKCAVGIYWYGANSMIKQFTARECSAGVIVTSMSGALEDIVAEACQTAYQHAGATAQLTGLSIRKPPKDSVAVLYQSGPLTLINCGLEPGQVKLGGELNKQEKITDRVIAMEYLVVGVKGAPAGAQVEVKTLNPQPPLAPGAVDLNIRNAPASIVNGLTPLPQTLAPIIVRSWVLDVNFKPQPAPDYTINVLAAADKPGAPRPVLKSLNVKPQAAWFRAKPNEPVPTLEIPLK